MPSDTTSCGLFAQPEKHDPQISLFRKKGETSEPVSELPPTVQEVKTGGQKELWDRLISYGISEASADRYLHERSDEYIMENLDIVEKNYQAGKVENLPSYTAAALERDYRPKMSQYEAEQAGSIGSPAKDRIHADE